MNDALCRSVHCLLWVNLCFWLCRGFAPPTTASGPVAPVGSAPHAGGVAAGGNTKWPDSLHDYVKRAFARCNGAADQALTQQTLKELITNAIMGNNLWTRNWTVEPLPTLVGDTKPAAMNAAAPSVPKAAPVFNKYGPGPRVDPPGSFIGFNQAPAMSKKNKRKQYVLELDTIMHFGCSQSLLLCAEQPRSTEGGDAGCTEEGSATTTFHEGPF